MQLRSWEVQAKSVKSLQPGTLPSVDCTCRRQDIEIEVERFEAACRETLEVRLLNFSFSSLMDFVVSMAVQCLLLRQSLFEDVTFQQERHLNPHVLL